MSGSTAWGQVLSVSDTAIVREKLNINDFHIQRIDLPAGRAAATPVTTTVELEGVPRTLHLWPHSVRAPEYQLLARGAGGKLTPLPVPPPRTFLGRINNVPVSNAAVSIIDGQLSGQIHDGHATWWIQPLDDAIPGSDRRLHVTFKPSDINPGDWRCGTDADGIGAGDAGGVEGGIAGSVPTGCTQIAKIAIDSDFEYYQLNNSNVTDTQNDIDQILLQVNMIYQPQVQIRHELAVAIIVQTAEPDPYTWTDPFLLLTEFENYWNANHTDIDRDVAHLMTGKDIDDPVIGIAEVATVCNVPFAYGLSQSLFTTNLTNRVLLTAHELGHNWGAGHCNNAPACPEPCSIMCSFINGCPTPTPTQFESCSHDAIVAFRNQLTCLEPPSATFDEWPVDFYQPNDVKLKDRFGTSVAIDGELAIVGAPGTEPSTGTGSAYIYRFDSESQTWNLETELTPINAEFDNTTNDQFGAAVDIIDDPVSGLELAVVGAWSNDLPELSVPQGSDTREAGAAYIFRNMALADEPAIWVQDEKIHADDYNAGGGGGNEFGRAVSVVDTFFGHIVLVAAPKDDSPGNAGSVYAFRGNTLGTWVQESKMRGTKVNSNDQFGFAIDMKVDQSGNVFTIIGEWQGNDDFDPMNDSGAVYFFRRELPEWELIQKFTADDPTAGDRFGCSVGLSFTPTGPVAIIGALTKNFVDNTNKKKPVNIGDAGAAYIFRDTGSEWVQEQLLFAPEPALNDRFGNAVAISGDIALIGALRDDDFAIDTGSAYVYRHTTEAGWTLDSTINANNPAQFNNFGSSVALQGEQVLIGSMLFDNSTTFTEDQGAVYFGQFTPMADCNGNGVFDPCDIENGTSIDSNFNEIPDECEPCPPDIGPPPEGDDLVNVIDLLAVISGWGPCAALPATCPADIAPAGGDGFVNVVDLLAVIGGWGPCPP